MNCFRVRSGRTACLARRYFLRSNPEVLGNPCRPLLMTLNNLKSFFHKCMHVIALTGIKHYCEMAISRCRLKRLEGIRSSLVLAVLALAVGDQLGPACPPVKNRCNKGFLFKGHLPAHPPFAQAQ